MHQNTSREQRRAPDRARISKSSFRPGLNAIAACIILCRPANAGDLYMSHFLFRVPMTGQVDCVVKGKTFRVDSQDQDWESWLPKGARVVDVCVNPSSVILTENGARAQFIYGFGGKEGNNYASGWSEMNCRSMERRSSNGWEFQLTEPSLKVKQARAVQGGRYIMSRYGYWSLITPVTWTSWTAVTNHDALGKWLCAQWKSSAKG